MTSRAVAFAWRVGVLVACCLALPGCYFIQAAHGEAQVLEKRRPIPSVVADSHTPPALRATLEEVLAARQFATQVLGLPDNKSYRTYSDIGRSYVVWNVVAAPELSVTPVHWCFPVVGCVAYRGYFKEKSARDFGAHLRERGFDVVVEGVPAYSTLGRFADPVLNTMIDYGDTELAAIIFHELAHQLLYVAGDSSFNEAFATTVEQEGLKRWLISRGQLEELRRYEASTVRQLQYLALFRRTRAQLASLYASKVPAATMRERKHALFEQLAKDMRSLEQSQHRRSGYDDWLEQGLNNAHLASLATYYDCVPGFERMLKEQNGDLERFYAAVRDLSHQPKAQRDAAVCTAAPAPGTTRADRASPSVARAR